MKEMPENFPLSKTYPFKIFIIKKIQSSASQQGTKPKNEYYATVEKLSVLYDFYNDQEISIENIGTPLLLKSGYNDIVLVTNLGQKGNLITSANIQVFQNGNVPQTEFDSNHYPTKVYTVLGSVNIVDDEYFLSQNVRSNLTKFACVELLREL